MSKKKTKIETKKAAVLGAEKRKSNRDLLIVGCAALVIGGALMLLFQGKGKLSQAPPQAVVEDTVLTFPVAELADGTSRFFEHKTKDGLEIRFFVLQSSDGVVRSAFDACDSCWQAGKGYRQVGDYMVCQNCRRRFASVKVMEEKGGCNPAPLANRVEDGRVVFQIEDIEAGAAYFQPYRGG